MRISVYKNISKIASRIRSEVLSRYCPGDRIPSEIEIAEQLEESQNRVHRALVMLIQEGLIYSSGGRRGMYFTPLLSGTVKRRDQMVKLKFSLPSAVNAIQYRHWERVAEMFHMVEPSVEIELVANPKLSADIGADCYLLWLPLLDCSPFRPIDLSKISAVKGMVKDIVKTGVQYNKQYGLPVFHAPGAFWGHRNMLRKCGLKKENFKEPYDCFSWGDYMQSKGLCVHGFTFFGYVYHAANWGIDIRRRGNEFLMDPRKIKRFFKHFSKYLGQQKILSTTNNMAKLFHRGQQGIMAGYLNSHPITENRFELLGQPLLEDGFSCQTIFHLAIGKNTAHENVVYDFFRFILMDHIQELFLSPEINFSVNDRVYRSQYRKICETLSVTIPPFDMRGIYPMQDLDLVGFTGRYLYLETMEVLLGYKNPDKVVESISRINIPERRRIFLETASATFLEEYKPYIEYLKENGEL
ncbi:MAG: GntR family transcriptional regulator [Lentisphaeria bacterium]|nr:GntR family transcriptional regulator [Lentisphaeria bacterium]